MKKDEFLHNIKELIRNELLEEFWYLYCSYENLENNKQKEIE